MADSILWQGVEGVERIEECLSTGTGTGKDKMRVWKSQKIWMECQILVQKEQNLVKRCEHLAQKCQPDVNRKCKNLAK